MSESITRTRHLLQRTGFAEAPARVAAAAAERPDALLEARLRSDAPIAPLPPPAWTDEPILTYRTFRELEETRRRAANVRLNRIRRERVVELQAWWIENLIRTDHPLGARMTLFWQNHFTSEWRKVRYAELVHRQHAMLMAHATGRFDALLLAVLRDPAMLTYLDNRRSRRSAVNENLARELLELFTLGEGEYTESDVRELARALTGLSVDAEEAFRFKPNLHDPDPKAFLGADGVRGVEDVVELLARHPATARHLTEKLWRHFVSPEPDPERVAAFARTFRDGDLDVRTLLGTLFGDEAFGDPAIRGTLVKSPLEFIVGTHRALALAPADPLTLVRAARAMQQLPYEPPNVRGWVGGKRWINSATLLARRRFVNGLLRDDALDLAAVQGDLSPDALVASLLPIAPVTPLPRPSPGPRARTAGATRRGWAGGPVAHLLRDPVYHLS